MDRMHQYATRSNPALLGFLNRSSEVRIFPGSPENQQFTRFLQVTKTSGVGFATITSPIFTARKPISSVRGVFEREPGSGIWWIGYEVNGKPKAMRRPLPAYRLLISLKR